jgi:hypothetical protein
MIACRPAEKLAEAQWFGKKSYGLRERMREDKVVFGLDRGGTGMKWDIPLCPLVWLGDIRDGIIP